MSEEKKVKATEKEKIVKVAPVQLEPVVYIGPDYPGKLRKNTTYLNGMPAIAKEIAKKNSVIEKLFVPVSKVADAKQQINVKNSALYIMYQKSLENKED